VAALNDTVAETPDHPGRRGKEEEQDLLDTKTSIRQTGTGMMTTK